MRDQTGVSQVMVIFAEGRQVFVGLFQGESLRVVEDLVRPVTARKGAFLGMFEDDFPLESSGDVSGNCLGMAGGRVLSLG